MKYFRQHSFFLTILVCCAILRLWPLMDYQFTYDELSGLDRTRFDNWHDLIHQGIKVDAHPALVQLLIFCIVKIFGYKTWLIKLPFILLSLATLCYAYLAALKNFSKNSAQLITLFLAFSLVFVYHAPIARMYTPGLFFSFGLLYYFLNLCKQQEFAIKNYIFLSLFLLLCAYNHHMNALFSATLYLSGFFLLPRLQLIKYLLSGLGAIILYLPHLGVTLYQLSLGGIGREQGGWLEAPEWYAFVEFINIIIGTAWNGILFLILLLVTIILNKSFRLQKIQWFLLMAFSINYLVIYLYSVYKAPIYQHSVILFSGAGLLLVIASLTDSPRKLWMFALTGIMGLSLALTTYIKKDYYTQCVKTVFEYQFAQTIKYKQQHGEANVYPVFFDADDVMKKIYFKKYKCRFELKYGRDEVVNSMKAYSRFVSQLPCQYLVLSAAMPAQQALARQYFPYLVENTQTQGINFKVYSKNPADAGREVEDDLIYTLATPQSPELFRFSNDLEKPMEFKPGNEFPYSTETNYQEAVCTEGNVVLLEAEFKILSGDLNGLETCISVSNEKTKTSYGYTARRVSDFVLNHDSTVRIYTDYFAGTTHNLVSPGGRLACYVWNHGQVHARLKNFKVQTIFYWKNKWDFWN